MTSENSVNKSVIAFGTGDSLVLSYDSIVISAAFLYALLLTALLLI